jgi:hypothetical protein
METITINHQELKKMMQEAFIDVLTNRSDLVEDAVIQAIEDIGLGIAMNEGKTGEFIDSRVFLQKLDKKIKESK